MAAFKWPAVAALIAILGWSLESKTQLETCERRFPSIYDPQTFSSAEYFLSAQTTPSSASSDFIKAIALAFSGAAGAPQSGVARAHDRVVQATGKIVDPVNAGCQFERRGFHLSRIIARNSSRGSTLDVAIQFDR